MTRFFSSVGSITPLSTGTSTPRPFWQTVAAVIKAGIADFVVGADGLGDAQSLDAFAGHDAGLEFILTHEQQAAEFVGQLRAAGIDHDHRNAGGDRF